MCQFLYILLHPRNEIRAEVQAYLQLLTNTVASEDLQCALQVFVQHRMVLPFLYLQKFYKQMEQDRTVPAVKFNRVQEMKSRQRFRHICSC